MSTRVCGGLVCLSFYRSASRTTRPISTRRQWWCGRTSSPSSTRPRKTHTSTGTTETHPEVGRDWQRAGVAATPSRSFCSSTVPFAPARTASTQSTTMSGCKWSNPAVRLASQTHRHTDTHRQTHDRALSLRMSSLMCVPSSSNASHRVATMQFWATAQRFFRILLVATKIPTAVRKARKVQRMQCTG